MSTWLTSARLLFMKYSTYLTRCFSAELGVLSAQFGVGCLCAHLLAHFCSRRWVAKWPRLCRRVKLSTPPPVWLDAPPPRKFSRPGGHRVGDNSDRLQVKLSQTVLTDLTVHILCIYWNGILFSRDSNLKQKTGVNKWNWGNLQ